MGDANREKASLFSGPSQVKTDICSSTAESLSDIPAQPVIVDTSSVAYDAATVLLQVTLKPTSED
jgi:hypothetical protein